MYIQQLYTGCLSEAAYYIESNGEAAVVDPLRDIESYTTLAKERNAVIRYIFETHFHADFVSGHLDLGKITGAPIIYGPETRTKFPVRLASDGETFPLGNVTIKVLHTPGHTIESSCYLLQDENGRDHAIFTGDTLFVGDVGRPDLSRGNLDREELAAIMYDTIQTKILTLHDDVIVYPAHGEGSSCGKYLSSKNVSTIGEERRNNYALQPQSKADFIKAVTEGLDEAPKYFSETARFNMEGYDSLETVKSRGLAALNLDEFKEKLKQDIIILDTRHADLFVNGFVPGSISIGLEGRFAEWAGNLLSFNKPIVLVTEPGKEEETVVRLARVGFSKVEGFLEGGFETWRLAGEKIDMIISVEADELAMDIPHDPNLQVVDVRREAEYADGHVKNAINMPLNDMTDVALLAGFEDHQNLYVHCGRGYRSVIACSLMKSQGINNLRNISGGWEQIKKESSIKIAREPSVLN